MGSSFSCRRPSWARDGMMYDPYWVVDPFFERVDSGMRTTMTFISEFFAKRINLSWAAIISLMLTASYRISLAIAYISENGNNTLDPLLKSVWISPAFPFQHRSLEGLTASFKSQPMFLAPICVLRS